MTSLRPWQTPNGSPRRAGVSSFGVGGTNATSSSRKLPGEPRPRRTAPSSCSCSRLGLRPPSRLPRQGCDEHLVDSIRQIRLADVAFTLQVGRRRFSAPPGDRGLRRSTRRSQRLERPRSQDHGRRLEHGRGRVGRVPVPRPGSAVGGHGAGLVRRRSRLPCRGRRVLGDPAAASSASTCATCSIHSPATKGSAEQRLAQTEVTQPALFVIEYALAMAWRRLGIEPDGMIGHSVGEYVAACLGGVFTRDDALRLVAARGRLMQTLPPGAMLAVRADADEVRKILSDGPRDRRRERPRLDRRLGRDRRDRGLRGAPRRTRSDGTAPGDVSRLPLRDDGPDPRGVRPGRRSGTATPRRPSRGSPASRETGSPASRRRTASTGSRSCAGPSSSARASRGCWRLRRG